MVIVQVYKYATFKVVYLLSGKNNFSIELGIITIKMSANYKPGN